MQRHSHLKTTLILIITLLSAFSIHAKSSAQKKHSSPGTINLQQLNKKYRNALVRIEFTPIVNLSETILNPSKSERYVGRNSNGSHGSGFFIRQSFYQGFISSVFRPGWHHCRKAGSTSCIWIDIRSNFQSILLSRLQ